MGGFGVVACIGGFRLGRLAQVEGVDFINGGD